jgi:flagellar biosynthesis/type III secretory pathway M-ring protein FliF/YscJ
MDRLSEFLWLLVPAVLLVLVAAGGIRAIRRRRALDAAEREAQDSEPVAHPAARSQAPETTSARDDEPTPPPSTAPPAGEVTPLEDERKRGRTFVDDWLGDEDDR